MIQVLGIFIALAGLSALLYALEWTFPSVPGQPLWRPDSKLDLLYWLCTPLVTKAISKAVAVTGVVVALAALGRHIGPGAAHGFGPVTSQPQWVIVLEMFLLGDVIGYWTHRWFHGTGLWKFHAVHHSSTQLDWLSAVRVHPVNDALSKLLLAVALACLGFPLPALAAYVPFLTFYAILLHANVNWSFGPLRYVIASPRFHRWHHTTEEQGLDKNFAPLFPFVDLLFGTFYMPPGESPSRFGVNGTRVPETFHEQLLFPFRSCQGIWAHATVLRPGTQLTSIARRALRRARPVSIPAASTSSEPAINSPS
jgi:sterol desaturase/sphingolipid hydroxylase (fatty acid hydroxylase superfamily)